MDKIRKQAKESTERKMNQNHITKYDIHRTEHCKASGFFLFNTSLRATTMGRFSVKTNLPK